MRKLTAIGVEHFSPGQIHFRNTNGTGRSIWPVDGTPAAMATAYNVNCNYDGTVDMIRLEAGFDGWRDLGGKGAYDVRAGR
jgi:hypothetical protein